MCRKISNADGPLRSCKSRTADTAMSDKCILSTWRAATRSKSRMRATSDKMCQLLIVVDGRTPSALCVLIFHFIQLTISATLAVFIYCYSLTLTLTRYLQLISKKRKKIIHKNNLSLS